MAEPWKVSCRMTASGSSGSAGGEFSRLDDALAFADSWLGPGWSGTLTNPAGVQVVLEKGKRPMFPRCGPGNAATGRNDS